MDTTSRRQFFNPPRDDLTKREVKQQVRRQFTRPLVPIVGGFPQRVRSPEEEAIRALRRGDFLKKPAAEPKPEVRGPIKAGISRAAVLRERRRKLPKSAFLG
jgi:hypothetical protein